MTDEQYEELATPSDLFRRVVNVVLGAFVVSLIAGIGLALIEPYLEKSDYKPTEKASKRRPVINQFTPQGIVDDLDRITLTFNKPIVEEDRLDVMFDTFPLRMKPDLEPRFMWRTNKRLEITTEKRIPPGTEVQLTLTDTPIKDLSGRPLFKKSAWPMTFIYQPLKVQDVDFNGRQAGGFDFRVQFSAPVKASEFDSHLTVELSSGETLPYELRNPGTTDEEHLITVSKPDLFGRKLFFTIEKGLKTAEGNYPLQNPVTESYKIGELAVSYLRGRSSGGEPYVEVNFNRRLRGVSTMREYITINGDTSFPFRVSKMGWDELKVTSERFQFGEDYQFTFHRGMSSGIFELGENDRHSVTIPDADPYLKTKTTGIFQSVHGEQVLPLEHINTDNVHITAYDIYDNNLIFFANHYQYSTHNFELFEKVKEVRYDLPDTNNRTFTSHIDLNDLFDGEMYGPKLLKINHPNHYRTNNRLLILSDLGISFKKYEDQIAVLVTSLKDGTPVSNARVKLYSRANQVITSGRTNSNGFVRFNDVNTGDQKMTVVMAEKGRDMNYLHLDRGDVPTVAFDVEGDQYTESGEVEAYVYGEREIYRPGETVKLNVLGRGQDFRQLPNIPLDVTITGPDGSEVLERTVRLNDLGVAPVNYKSWSDDKTGFYTVSVSRPGEGGEQLGTEQFQLEEFVPDRIETLVETDETLVHTGDSVSFEVKGQYLFGKPAANNDVQASYTLYPRTFQPPGYKEYEFGDHRVQFKEMYQQLESGSLDEDGKKQYSLSVPENLKPPSALELVMTGTVFEMGSRGVSGRASTLVHPYPFYIGINTEVKNPKRVPHGEDVPFNIVTVSPEGDTVVPDTLVARVYRDDWQYTLRRDNQGRTHYDWTKQEVLVHQRTIHPEEAQTDLGYEVSDWGDHVLEVRDPNSGARSSFRFSTGYWWRASGPGKKIDFNKAELTFDQSEYFAGETATAKLETPFNRGTAYIFKEDDEIEFLKTVDIRNREATFDVRLNRSEVPNTYVSALVLRGTEEAKFDAYRSIAVSPVKVIAPDRLAEVDIDLPETMTPGNTEPVTVNVTDPDGDPVDGEVALSVVDQGILQLAKKQWQNPYDFFYRRRGYFVKNADIYGFVAGEPDTEVRHRLTPSGAAEQAKREKKPFEVDEFEAVSQWYPSLDLNNGRTTVQYPVPKFSGQLTFRAWAVSENRVGQAETKKRVKEPLILRSVRPRTLSPGDTFSLPITVMNNLAEQVRGTLSVQSNHFLSGKWSNRDKVIEPEGRIQDNIVFTVAKEAGIARLTLTFETVKGKEVEKDFKIPVKPAYPRTKTTEFHVVKAGTTYSDTIGPRFFEGIGSHRFLVSTTPDVKVLSGLEYLINYPYGCIEQTTSSVFPQLYLKSFMTSIDPDAKKVKQIDENIHAGIERLLDMARPNGGFSYWPGRSHVDEYGSVYAGHFFAEASRAGYPVPESFLTKNKQFLKEVVQSHSERDKLRAYALYVLALHGNHDNVALAKSLLKNVDGYHKYYLVAALVMSGEKQSVSDYLNEETPTTRTNRTTSGVLQSNVISKAVVLNALIEANPDLPAVDAMATDLLDRVGDHGHWGSTHDNAQALIALGKYFSHRQSADDAVEGTLVVDGERRYSFNTQNDTAITVQGNANEFTVESEGEGQVHMSVISEGIPRTEQQVNVSRGMDLSHTFYDLQGKKITNQSFIQGEMYVVEIKATVQDDLDNYYIEDMIPGGFEIENQRLATSSTDIPALEEDTLEPEFTDVRDDRIAVFFDASHHNETVRYRYLVRATTSGHFRNPALSGGCMYDPDVQAVEKLSPLTITQ